MQRIVSFITPRAGLHIVIGVFVCMVLIFLSDVTFYLTFAKQELSVKMMALHAFYVGGPFVVGFYTITYNQLRLLRKLSLRSRKDGLTGLNNRQTFIELAQRRMQDMPRGMLLVLDADNFKAVNDTYGHAVGDTCLVAIGCHLRWSLRPEDVAGRIGGEEFAVLIAGVTIAQGHAIGQRLLRPIPFSGGPENPHLSITLSVGAAETSADLSLDRLLIRADEALYDAKKAGRGCLKAWNADRQVVA